MVITLNGGTVGTNDGITQYSSPSTTIALNQDGHGMGDLQDFSITDVRRLLPISSFLVIVTGSTIVIYDKETKAWSYIPRTGMRQKVQAFTWNEQECALRYGSGYKSTMSGYVEMDMSIKTTGRNEDSLFLYNMPPPKILFNT